MRLVKKFKEKIGTLPQPCCCCGERSYNTRNITAAQLKGFGVISDFSEKEIDDCLYVFDPVHVNEDTKFRICGYCRRKARVLHRRRLRNPHIHIMYGRMNTRIPKWKDNEWKALKGLSLVEDSMIAIVSPVVVCQSLLGMLFLFSKL